MKLTDISEAYTKLFALFIGRSSSGKTVAAASLPKPLVEMDFDLRANGIVNAVNQGWLNGDGIDIERFDPFKGVIPVLDYLNNQYTFINLRQFQYQSLDVGSLTSLIRLLDLTSINAPGKDGKNLHHVIAGFAMSGYSDYNFQTQSLHKILDYMRTFPCNITIAAHIVDKYGKAPGAKEPAPSIVLGEKLTLTANLSENVLAMFNDVYKFTKEMINGEDHYFVEFTSEIARNSYGIPPGRFDITRKNFWEEFQKIKKGEVEVSKKTGGLLQL